MPIPSSARRSTIAAWVIPVAVSIAIGTAVPASAATLDRIKQSGHIKLGYIADARPFTLNTGSAVPEGYTVELCKAIAESVKKQLNLPQLAVDWVPVVHARHVEDVKKEKIDLLCTPTSETAAKRKDVSYSKPVFPAGVRAIVRRDASNELRQALDPESKPQPTPRGTTVAKTPEIASFAVVAGTTTQQWLKETIGAFKINAKAVPVPDYRTGIQQLTDRKVDVFFGDRTLAVGAADLSATGGLQMLDRWFTQEPLALALPRDDADFRVLVDRTLSETYSSQSFGSLYSKWCGAMDERTRAFFQAATSAR